MTEIDRQEETELPLLYLQTLVARTDPRVIGFGYLQKFFLLGIQVGGKKSLNFNNLERFRC